MKQKLAGIPPWHMRCSRRIEPVHVEGPMPLKHIVTFNTMIAAATATLLFAQPVTAAGQTPAPPAQPMAPSVPAVTPPPGATPISALPPCVPAPGVTGNAGTTGAV